MDLKERDLIGQYKNGNYDVRIYSDGTKIRETEEDEFVADFPENIDLKITDYCNQGCAFCHENSSMCGQHGDIMNMEFLDTLMPHTELAIGGGDPMSHPKLHEFLEEVKKRGVIANLTVHQNTFMKYQHTLGLMAYEKLIHGIGVSVQEVTPDLIEALQKFPNAVVHVVNGIIEMDELRKMFGKNLKLLILGYKKFRRGEDYYSADVAYRMICTQMYIMEIMRGFRVTSFDNLALTQLEMKKILPPKIWETFYMGDDGQHTMYIDGVRGEYAKNSTSVLRKPIASNIRDMFADVKTW